MSNEKKSPTVEKLLNKVAASLYGRERTDDQCVSCGTKDVKEEHFEDALSFKEFGISRFCQMCQHEIFG